MSANDNKRIAKNTLFLYIRHLLILGVNLYAIRVVLNVLGITDYGIYNVIFGLVALASFSRTSISSAIQRFYSFTIGQGNTEQLKKTFSIAMMIFVVISIIAFILLETIGLWFLNHQLNIPVDRVHAAGFVYQVSVLVFIVSTFTGPFTASIVGHEDMHIYAYVSIVEALMKLGIVFILKYVPGDKLELYSMLVLMVACCNTLLYATICSLKYQECQYRKFYWDKSLAREMLGFSGWTLFGQLTSAGRSHGITILLNQFFTPAIVSARTLATNICGQINLFSNNFNTGLYPPIIKAYASNDKSRMFSLVENGSKITFFLMWIFALPLFLEMGTVLHLWLVQVPQDAILFTRLALIEALIFSVSLPVATAARAPGKMKFYELILGSIQIAIFLAAWLALKLGYAAFSVYVIAVVANIIMFYVRLVLVKRLTGLLLIPFLQRTIFPLVFVVLLSISLSSIIQIYLPNELPYRCASIFFNIIITAFCIYFVGLSKHWREKIRNAFFVNSRKYFLLFCQFFNLKTKEYEK